MSIRVSKQGMRLETLRTFSEQLHDEAMEDEKAIDFGSVGLYLAGLQVCFALVCCSCASVLCCWLMPPAAISAVRTLAITTVIGFTLVRRPLRVGQARGVMTVFNALRPAVPIYVLALVLEQLVHTCVESTDEHDPEQHGALRRGVYHVISVFLIISGFLRAKNPRSESDNPFLLTTFCLLAIAVLPPPAISRTGPLCEPTSLLGAGERVLRALLFAAVYVVLVYAAAPNRNISNELFICVARAAASSVWVLGASSWALPLAPVQVAVALFTRLHDTSGVAPSTDGMPSSYHYGHHHSEAMPLTARGATTPLDGGSDVELGDHGMPTDADSLKLALAGARALGANGYVGGGGGATSPSSCTGASNGLSFQFAHGQVPRSAQAAHGLNGAAVAAVLAREAGCNGASVPHAC
ncbi:MAG: hypothetical protein ACKVI4_14835 [Actinomycetales bacterium]